jgi:hypothetical protein
MTRASSTATCAAASGWDSPWWAPMGTSPDTPLVGIGSGAPEGMSSDPVGRRRRHDPFRVESLEDLLQAVPFRAQESVRVDHDVIEVHHELLLGRGHIQRYEPALQPGRVGIDDEDGQRRPAGCHIRTGLDHHHEGLGVIDSGDVVLVAMDSMRAIYSSRDRREPMEVRAGVGFRDGESHLGAAARKTG